MATIELDSYLAERLKAQADAAGLSLEAFLEAVTAAQKLEDKSLPRLSSKELDELLDAEASSEGSYSGTYPRADIYLDHD